MGKLNTKPQKSHVRKSQGGNKAYFLKKNVFSWKMMWAPIKYLAEFYKLLQVKLLRFPLGDTLFSQGLNKSAEGKVGIYSKAIKKT